MQDGALAKRRSHPYLSRMFKSFEFCLPTRSTTVPSGPDWLHEVKYDGYRLRLERDGDRVRLITRSGHNWTERYPWIVEAARKVRQNQLTRQLTQRGVSPSNDSLNCAFYRADA